MAKIQTLYNKATDEVIYPKTHERAVVDSNGTTLESKLQGFAPADNEDISVSGGVLKLKDRSFGEDTYSGYGRKILRENIVTEDVITDILRSPYTLTEGKAFYVNLDNYTLDYTNSSYQVSGLEAQRSTGLELDVYAGDKIEIQASAMKAAYHSIYVRYRLWVLVDPVTKEIIKDDDDNYFMADAGADYEDDPIILTIPKDGHLCISCWTGSTSRGQHNINSVSITTEEKEFNLFDSSLCEDANTAYIVRYDYDLNAREITLPKNSVLVFEGGSIKNSSVQPASLIGNKTYISSDLHDIFSKNVVLKGVWMNEEYYPEWFGAKGDGITDDTVALQTTLNIASSIQLPIQKIVRLLGSYSFSDTLNIYANTTLRGNAVGAHEENNMGIETLIANFSTNLKTAIQSVNLAKLNYNDGASRTSVDGGSIKYCNSVRIEDLRLNGNFVEVENDGVTTQRPIFCGIKIAASLNSSIRNVRVRGFWNGIARFATWYASDSDIFVHGYKIGYYASFDMNNFSIRNGYINSGYSELGISPTSEEMFATDPSTTSSIGILALYASGTLDNVISESSTIARYYASQSKILDLHSWLESNKTAYGIYGGANVTIINGSFVNNENFMSAGDSDVHLVGITPSGKMNISGNVRFTCSKAGSDSLQRIKGLPSGVERYITATKQNAWWRADTQIFTDANGFGLQDTWMGTYADRPKAGYMQPGAVYMKQEADGSVRPIFQAQEGTCGCADFSIDELSETNGTLVFTVGDTVFTFEYTASKYSTKAELYTALETAAIGQGFRADAYNNARFRLYNKSTGAITSANVSFDSGEAVFDNPQFKIPYYGPYGSSSVFVDALGGNAENDKKVSTLPVTATDGDILFYTVIGKPVYYSGGKWYDFSDNEVTNPVEES